MMFFNKIDFNCDGCIDWVRRLLYYSLILNANAKEISRMIEISDQNCFVLLGLIV